MNIHTCVYSDLNRFLEHDSFCYIKPLIFTKWQPVNMINCAQN